MLAIISIHSRKCYELRSTLTPPFAELWRRVAL